MASSCAKCFGETDDEEIGKCPVCGEDGLCPDCLMEHGCDPDEIQAAWDKNDGE